MNVNTQIQSMLSENNPLSGGYIKTLGPTAYKYITKEELANDLKGLISGNTAKCAQKCTTTNQLIPNPCGCGGMINSPVTTCVDCACMPATPDYVAGTPTVYCDYKERINVIFPTNTLTITKVVVNGVNATPSGSLTTYTQIEDYFTTILSPDATVNFVSGYIEITAKQVLTNFEYTVSGIPNVSIFNKTNCRTIDVGALNKYVFEQTPDGYGKWTKFQTESTYTSKQITHTSPNILSTNVGDALEELVTKISATEKYIVSMVATGTAGTYTATMNDGSTFSINLSGLLDNTDTQTLSVVAPTSIAISGGNTLDLSTLVKNAETDTTLDSVSLSNTGLVITSEVKYTGEDGAQQTKNDTTDITTAVQSLIDATQITSNLTNTGLVLTSTVDGQSNSTDITDEVQALVNTSIGAIPATTNSLSSSGLVLTSTVGGVADSEDITVAVQALINSNTDALVDNNDGTYTHTAVDNTAVVIDTRKTILGEEVGSTPIVLGENETLNVKLSTNPAHTKPYTDGATKTLFVPASQNSIVEMTAVSSLPFTAFSTSPATTGMGYNGLSDRYTLPISINLDNTPSILPVGKTKWKIVGTARAEFRSTNLNTTHTYRFRGDVNGSGTGTMISSTEGSMDRITTDQWVSFPIDIVASSIGSTNILNLTSEVIVDTGIALNHSGSTTEVGEIYFTGQFVAV